MTDDPTKPTAEEIITPMSPTCQRWFTCGLSLFAVAALLYLLLHGVLPAFGIVLRPLFFAIVLLFLTATVALLLGVFIVSLFRKP